MAIVFKHGANVGDLIASLAGIRQVCQEMGQKAIICQDLNVKAIYYPGAVHPVTQNGEMVCMNEFMFEMVKPLILSQSFVEDFQILTDQKTVVDLDVIRDRCFVNMPAGMIQSWVMMAFPDMAADLSKPWLTDIKPDPLLKGKIVLNYTERYRNEMIDYKFLKKYEEHLIFAGTDKEHALFCRRWELTMPYLKVDNFLDLAQCISGSIFFAGNQSSNWNIANAMGHPRLLEMCSYAPNCQPFVGVDNFGYFHQGGLEYYFERLFKQKNDNSRI